VVVLVFGREQLRAVKLRVEPHGGDGPCAVGADSAAGYCHAAQLELGHDARRELDAGLLKLSECHRSAARASQHVEHDCLLAVSGLGRAHGRGPS
jgi:hypothetical protein